MYCNSCGKQIEDGSAFCSFCGFSFEGNAGQVYNQQGYVSQDGPIGGLGVLCFLIPMLGLILYLVWLDTKPIKAKGAGKAALWSVGIILGLYFLGIVFVIWADAATVPGCY